MTTNNPKVQAILVTCTDKYSETVLSRGVRLIENHDPSCVNDNWNYEPLVRLSDHQKMQTDLDEELFGVRQTRDTHFREMVRALEQVDALKAENERLRKGLNAVQELIDSSYGVAGLHLNGDIAPWGDLREGGFFESWLVEFDKAIQEANNVG